MTGYVAFWASVDSDDAALIAAEITAWSGTDGKQKARDTGTETTWDSDGVEVFGHPASDQPGAPPQYLFEGQIPGTAAQGRQRLSELRDALTRRGAPASIDFQERDEDDEDVGDLETIASD